ncbi:hypothetical protein IWW38_000277 [Coemansia aciculifera]|uniref:Uncharacterized protein n=1 Tax=Coemansia aciculifera TaxID=417176 RepID=A0ACC1M9M5_9FUNG|nr:hypothetical protein IWW38_000277 [Coemansia aciculifera]
MLTTYAQESSASERLTECKEEDFTSVDRLIIGAGVVGLAVGRQLAQRGGSTLVVDKNRQFGMETSSRNSEVIHAGIYYPQDSLKTKLCIEGKHRLYAYCQQQGIEHRKVGKWVVAQGAEQIEYLHGLRRHCNELNVPAEIISATMAHKEEPMVRADAALVSPTTGIVDSHEFMASLLRELTDSGGTFAPNTSVVAMQRDLDAYKVLVTTGDPETPFMAIRAPVVVNAAGLWADRIANMLVPDSHPWRQQYRLHFAKGRYYVLDAKASARLGIRRLVYPVPDRNVVSLGTHLTLDLAGTIRFGPDVEWTASNDDYAPEGGAPIPDVVQAINMYLPAVRSEDLCLGYTGIRPKLQHPGGAFRDFVVREESDMGMPGLVNLIGIESPGLTSSLAIATMVDGMLH